MKISPSEQAIIYIRLRNAIESWTQNNSWLFIKVQCRSCLIYQLHPRQRQKYILVYFIISHTRLHDWPVCFLGLKTWAILCINLVRHERTETQQEDPSSIRQFLWAMKLLFLVDQDNYFSCGSEKKMFIKAIMGLEGQPWDEGLLPQRAWVHSQYPCEDAHSCP